MIHASIAFHVRRECATLERAAGGALWRWHRSVGGADQDLRRVSRRRPDASRRSGNRCLRFLPLRSFAPVAAGEKHRKGPASRRVKQIAPVVFPSSGMKLYPRATQPQASANRDDDLYRATRLTSVNARRSRHPSALAPHSAVPTPRHVGRQPPHRKWRWRGSDLLSDPLK